MYGACYFEPIMTSSITSLQLCDIGDKGLGTILGDSQSILRVKSCANSVSFERKIQA